MGHVQAYRCSWVSWAVSVQSTRLSPLWPWFDSQLGPHVSRVVHWFSPMPKGLSPDSSGEKNKRFCSLAVLLGHMGQCGWLPKALLHSCSFKHLVSRSLIVPDIALDTGPRRRLSISFRFVPVAIACLLCPFFRNDLRWSQRSSSRPPARIGYS